MKGEQRGVGGKKEMGGGMEVRKLREWLGGWKTGRMKRGRDVERNSEEQKTQ